MGVTVSMRGISISLILAGLVLLSACSRSADPDAAVAQLTAERACYQTLAEVDCFTKPQAGADLRKVGWFDGASVD